MDFFHAAALVPAAIGTCCTLGGGRRRGMAPQAVGSAAMLVAMADSVLGWGLLAPVAWAGILLLLAMTVGAAARPSGRRGAGREANGEQHIGAVMAVHAALGLVLMAGMAVAMGVAHGPSGAAAGHHGHDVELSSLLALAGIGYAVFTVWAAWSLRNSPLLGRVEVISMGLSALLMSGVMLA